MVFSQEGRTIWTTPPVDVKNGAKYHQPIVKHLSSTSSKKQNGIEILFLSCLGLGTPAWGTTSDSPLVYNYGACYRVQPPQPRQDMTENAIL